MRSGRFAARAAVYCMLAGLAATMVGQPRPADAADSPPTRLVGAGATFPAPLYKRWIENYEQSHPGASISYDAVGSGEGIKRFVAGQVDFGASDAVLSDVDIARVANGVVLVPATAGMIVLAYNLPGFDGDLELPRDVYPDIFAGKITNWDDPRLQAANPGHTLPHRTIAVVGRLDGSGTNWAFTRHLATISATWRDSGRGYGTLVEWPATTMLVRGNEGVAARIKISEGSIGYVEYGFAKRLGLPLAALQNKAGTYVLPTEASGQTALGEATAAGGDLRLSAVDPEGDRSYPIVTYSWLLLYGSYADPAKAAAVRDFVGWGLGQGQTYAGEFGYIPLPPSVSRLGDEAIATVR